MNVKWDKSVLQALNLSLVRLMVKSRVSNCQPRTTGCLEGVPSALSLSGPKMGRREMGAPSRWHGMGSAGEMGDATSVGRPWGIPGDCRRRFRLSTKVRIRSSPTKTLVTAPEPRTVGTAAARSCGGLLGDNGGVGWAGAWWWWNDGQGRIGGYFFVSPAFQTQGDAQH